MKDKQATELKPGDRVSVIYELTDHVHNRASENLFYAKLVQANGALSPYEISIHGGAATLVEDTQPMLLINQLEKRIKELEEELAETEKQLEDALDDASFRRG